jgi:hypothetical protein
MVFKFNPNQSLNSEEVTHYIENFQSQGIILSNGTRNCIKIFGADHQRVAIKSFKVPGFFGKIIYKYFRKSKARRSYEYAIFLTENGIGTPLPIAFQENYDAIGLTTSYYVSAHLDCDLTFRELVQIPDYPNHEKILRAFTKFSFNLHQKGIEFKDHSPGNTLINKLEDGTFSFALVDLNRMNFHDNMSFDLRMKNLSRLTPLREMVQIMSNEYAKHYSESEADIFEKMWGYTQEFQRKFHRKQNFKKKFKR